MTTTAQHAQNIADLAEEADTLIGQLRTKLEAIEAEENALFLNAIKSGENVVEAIDGRRRLAWFAREQVHGPGGAKSVAALASSAWEEYL